VAKALPSITVNCVRYRVLRLEPGTCGPRYLLRNTPASSSASMGATRKPRSRPRGLSLKLAVDNPFRGFDFFEMAEGGLLVRR
jgi:hypothetical protein